MARRVVVLALTAFLTLPGGTAALAAPGDFDGSFSGDGVARFDWGGFDGAEDVLVQPNGRILTVGFGDSDPAALDDDFMLGRITADGARDTSFSLDGVSPFALAGDEWGYAVERQPDGKIVAVGETQAGANRQAVVVRTNPDGSPDGSFGSGGVVTLDFGGTDSFFAVAIQPDGRIVAAGTGGPNSDAVAARLTPGGVPDASFDGDGVALFDFIGTDRARTLALQPDGKLVLGGDTTGAGVWVARVSSDGTLDASFGLAGRRPLDPASGDFAEEVLLQPDGRIVLVGSAPDDGFLITRLTPSGDYDGSFGDGQGVTGFGFPNGSTSDFARAAVLQANGKIVIAGYSSFANNSRQLGVARVQPGGSLDTTFSSDGLQTLSGGNSFAYGVALQADGRIVVAGDDGTDTLVARLEGDRGAAGGGPVGGGPGGGPGGPRGQAVPRCAGKRATIVGSNRSDRLKGTRRADVIVALGGNDKIAASRGNDRICAGNGNDRIDGGSGNDRLLGGSGRDALAGGSGADALDGGTGNDKLGGGPGKDNLAGGSGKDRLSGGPGKGDKCAGNAGNDRANCERERA